MRRLAATFLLAALAPAMSFAKAGGALCRLAATFLLAALAPAMLKTKAVSTLCRFRTSLLLAEFTFFNDFLDTQHFEGDTSIYTHT